MFTVSFCLALMIFLSLIIASFVIVKNKKRLNLFYCVFAAVFLSAIILFVPIYYDIFSFDKVHIIKTFLLSIHNAIRLFIVDGEFNIIKDYLPSDLYIYEPYSLFAAILFVLAPLLTFGAVLSLFKNIVSYLKLSFNYNSELYVFSELNKKSLALAHSLLSNGEKRLVVFTDVFERNEEENYELISAAKNTGALCFNKDISEFNFNKIHSNKKAMSLFIIGDDDSENISQSLKIVEKYKSLENVSLYLFSNTSMSELFMNSLDKGSIKVRRINECQSLVFRNLYDNGMNIFDNACNSQNSNQRIISAVIVGIGGYGTEMLKALPWFCQMDNYRLFINAFDKDVSSKTKFCSVCPELMKNEYNGNFENLEESIYNIDINSGIDVLSSEFDETLSSIENATYVFVALGDDELNVSVSLKIRSIFESKGIHPKIQTVVYRNTCTLNNLVNFKGQKIDIEFIGDIESSYSENVILHSDLEKEALNRHLKWGKEEEFWNYEYNYRSSMASAIHKKMKQYCNTPGINKNADNRTEDEKLLLRMLEHRRWNAYMRSEGYKYAPVRNDLAKQHYCLVSFNMLSDVDKKKDDD